MSRCPAQTRVKIPDPSTPTLAEERQPATPTAPSSRSHPALNLTTEKVTCLLHHKEQRERSAAAVSAQWENASHSPTWRLGTPRAGAGLPTPCAALAWPHGGAASYWGGGSPIRAQPPKSAKTSAPTIRAKQLPRERGLRGNKYVNLRQL